MKTVLIDVYKAKLPYSGLGQFSIHLAANLQRSKTDGMEFHFLYPEFDNSWIDSEKHVHKANWKTRYLPSIGRSFDLWHSIQQFPSHKPPANTPQLLTIHDLNFLVEKTPAKAAKYLRRLQKNVDNALALSTISEFTKAEISKHIDLNGKKVHVIYNGIPAIDGKEKNRPKGIPDAPFLFSMGIFNAKKNFLSLLPMMQHIPSFMLILAGDHETSYGSELKNEISNLGIEKQIILLGKVNDSEKQWLYSECSAFVFPSIAEGFGMPIIEAMQYGKPVICSNYSALPEIGGSIACYFQSFDPLEMSNTVLNEIENFNQNQSLRKKEAQRYAEKFNWNECSAAYIHLYKELLNLA